MPSWYLDVFDRGFVLPLTKSISEHLSSQPDSFHIAYFEGEPKQEWKQFFSFHKLNMPYKFVKSRMARFYLSRRKTYSQIKDIEADVIFTLSDPWAQEFSRYCSRRMGIPYVVRLRGKSREVRKAMRVNWIKEKMLNYLDARGLKQANLVIPNSKDLAEKAEEWGVERGKITEPVYNGVDTRMFRPMNVEKSGEFTVAYAGRISPEKGVQRLLRIAEKLAGVRFLIAGKKQMGISFPSNVEYVGELPFSEMPKFYNKANLVVLPSFTEGFPNAVLEAYACGKPVLVAKEAFPEELKVFGSVADIEEFAAEIKALRRSDLKAVGRQARSYVKQAYSWEKFGQSIIEHLDNVMIDKVTKTNII